MKKQIFLIIPVLLLFTYLLIQSCLFMGFEFIRITRGKAKFNPEKWDIATNCRLDWAYIIDIKDSKTISLDSSCNEYFRKILKSLGPLTSIDSDTVNSNQTNYILKFQSGMDVTEIPVAINECELYAWIADEWWKCGSFTTFTNLLYGLNEIQGARRRHPKWSKKSSASENDEGGTGVVDKLYTIE